MKLIHKKQNWKGFFTYLEGHESSEKYLDGYLEEISNGEFEMRKTN